MHWNILADKLAYGSFSKVPNHFLNWNYRFNLIQQHIKQVGPDIVGLSELDVIPRYNEVATFMNKLGYNDYFVEKFNNGPSGSGIFYKKDKLTFECIKKN